MPCQFDIVLTPRREVDAAYEVDHDPEALIAREAAATGRATLHLARELAERGRGTSFKQAILDRRAWKAALNGDGHRGW